MVCQNSIFRLAFFEAKIIYMFSIVFIFLQHVILCSVNQNFSLFGIHISVCWPEGEAETTSVFPRWKRVLKLLRLKSRLTVGFKENQSSLTQNAVWGSGRLSKVPKQQTHKQSHKS